MVMQPEHQAPERHFDAVRTERDRYVAFAFAAADLLIEIDKAGIIATAHGASQRIFGRPGRELAGKTIDSLTAASHQCLIRQLIKQAPSIGRVDPILVLLVRPDGSTIAGLVGACQLPNLPRNIFLSVSTLPAGVTFLNPPRDEETGLLTKEGLLEALDRDNARPDGAPGRLKLLQLDGLTSAAGQIAPDCAAMMMEEIGAVLRAHSEGSDKAGRLADDSFGYIAGSADDDPRHEALLLKNINGVFRQAGIKDGQVTTRAAEVDLTTEGLADGDVGLAIAYAIKKFVGGKGEGFTIQTLAGGLAGAVAETVCRVTETRRIITDGEFSLVYQSVVQIKTGVIHHYEALARFTGTNKTFETITFSEDVGLIATLDMSICERAIKAMRETPGSSVAVNLSGRSIQTESFRQSLSEMIRPLNDLRGRLLFELTESAVVEDLEEAANFLRWIRKIGHEVCLDDFGAGAAAYSYLRRFDVDFVKIDGPFLNAASKKARDRALIQSISTLCTKLGCGVIGEMIEDEKTAALATSMGIEYGQGWLWGKPISILPMPVMAGKRKGTQETWG